MFDFTFQTAMNMMQISVCATIIVSLCHLAKGQQGDFMEVLGMLSMGGMAGGGGGLAGLSALGGLGAMGGGGGGGGMGAMGGLLGGRGMDWLMDDPLKASKFFHMFEYNFARQFEDRSERFSLFKLLRILSIKAQ